MTEHIHEHLKISDVHFGYGGAEVLKGISLDLDRGEIVGILGPNGAGKSTLVKVMAGLLRPMRGIASLEGESIHDMRANERARRIAVVGQDWQIPFPFGALEVVLMGRAPHLPVLGLESRRDIEIAREAMERTDCWQFADRDINSLSGGERQRVFIARALAQEPEILLLDEPTTFLDIKHQISLHSLLKKLNQENGITIVTAMHDLNLAAVFCERIAILKDGAIATTGSPSDVITADTIFRTFGARVRVIMDNETGLPLCMP